MARNQHLRTPVPVFHTSKRCYIIQLAFGRMASGMLFCAAMRFLPLLALLATASWVLADVPEAVPVASELNVNSRYTVESIDFSPQQEYRLSDTVMDEMRVLIGERLNVEALGRLSRHMAQELKARSVTFRVSRGNIPAHVRVTFEVERQETNFDVSLSKLMYDSRLGWSGTAQAKLTSGNNALTFAGLSNSDDLVERYSGIRARFDRLDVGSDRVRLSFEFDAYRDQYDSATLGVPSPNSSSLGAGAYGSRMNFEPSATFVLAQPLTLSVGFSFEDLQSLSTGGSEYANAFTDTLHYHQFFGETGGDSQDVDAVYRMRVATRLLGSSTGYTRHSLNLRYTIRHQRQMVEVALLAGVIYGRAPLFERFVLGDTSTLRGWSKDDLDPLGGNRVAHASVTYGYHIMRVFYDTGSVWDRKGPDDKSSVGAGVTTGLGVFSKDALLLAVAFPLRQGRVFPVFMAGMNF